MKRLITVILAVVLFIAPLGVYAQTDKKSEVENLKDKIASTVAELAKKNKKAVAGTVSAVSKGVITLQTEEGTRYAVKTDEDLTKFYSISGSSKKEITLEELEKGAYIIVSGPITDLEISANAIYQDEQFLAESGKIVEVDKEAFVIRVLTQQKQEYMLDVESDTSQQILNIKTFEAEKIGFTKMKEGDEIHFIVAKAESTGNKNRYSAKRIFIIPQEYFVK